MKRRFTQLFLFMLCAVCALSVFSPAAAEAAVSDYYVQRGVYDFALVTGAYKVNMRQGPGTGYEWSGAAEEGKWVGITGENGNWYSVFLPETSQYGYMSKNYLKRAGDAAEPGVNSGVVSNPKATQFLNLRAYPSYDAQVLGIYYNGAAFTLLSAGSDGWYQVQINGQTGYFRREYVRLNGASAASQFAYIRSDNSGRVNLRNAPTYIGSDVIGQYEPGTQVIVLMSSTVAGSFWKVSVSGQVGYMDSTFLRLASSPVSPSQPAAQGTAVVNNPKASQYLNLRAQPSTSAKVITQYRNGTRFEVLQAGETWTKVYGTATGNVGYFMTKYLKLSGASFNKVVQNGNSYVNLRSSPSKTTGKVYMKVPSGAVVTVLTPGEEWTQVRYAGTVGYMMTYFLK